MDAAKHLLFARLDDNHIRQIMKATTSSEMLSLLDKYRKPAGLGDAYWCQFDMFFYDSNHETALEFISRFETLVMKIEKMQGKPIIEEEFIVCLFLYYL